MGRKRILAVPGGDEDAIEEFLNEYGDEINRDDSNDSTNFDTEQRIENITHSLRCASSISPHLFEQPGDLQLADPEKRF